MNFPRKIFAFTNVASDGSFANKFVAILAFNNSVELNMRVELGFALTDCVTDIAGQVTEDLLTHGLMSPLSLFTIEEGTGLLQ